MPAGAPDRGAVTSVKVSQPPVTGTVAVPSSVPVGEPALTWMEPPTPPELTRALNDGMPDRTYGSNSIQSPFSMLPTVLAPCAVALSNSAMPCEVV